MPERPVTEEEKITTAELAGFHAIAEESHPGGFSPFVMQNAIKRLLAERKQMVRDIRTLKALDRCAEEWFLNERHTR